ncbi:MAG: ATP-dependent helicase [Muribaculaceae bacterium]|nr:ATP-dependent helicase [Muribaculaceae bacterium]
MDDPVFSNLNPRQAEAVETTEGRVRIVAGAGSGKTRVLAHRFAHLVNNLGIDPGNILCMTFTNKAAAEMRTRIARMVSAGNANDFVCTIHGFCVKVLRRDIYRLGFPANFTILDDGDTEQLAKQVLELHGMDRTQKTVRLLTRGVAHHKFDVCPDYIDRYMLPSSPRFRDTRGLDEVESYIHYQALNYCLDFDDLVLFTLYLFKRFPEVREYWQDTLNYVMVDEVQDCNAYDWKIIRLVSGKYRNLFVVGDPDQAIYEWRGARPSEFVDWEADRTVILDENYRSTPDILSVANAVISNNRHRIPKELFTRRPAGVRGVHLHAPNEGKEARMICREIEKLHKEGAPYSDFAILYRASHLTRSLEQELLHRRIPYVIWGGVRFFERREIKDSLAYLRLVAQNDNLSFARIVNVPSRRFGRTSLNKIREYSRQERRPCFEVLKDHLEEWQGTRAYKPLKDFIALIESARGEMMSTTVSELLNKILKDSGLTQMIREDPETERLENVEELLSSIRHYEACREPDEISVPGYLQDISLFTNADYRADSESVKLMTIHQAKGLEFPVVFVSGLSEGIFPSHRSLRERRLAALEEERRLMYVAVTRAERRLYLSESEGFNFQTSADKFPSRFLAEIPENLLLREGKMDRTLWDGSRMLARAIDAEVGIRPREDASAPVASSSLGPAPFKPGDRVTHKFFGEGVILEVTSDGMKARVRFGADSTTDRQLMTRVLMPVQ